MLFSNKHYSRLWTERTKSVLNFHILCLLWASTNKTQRISIDPLVGHQFWNEFMSISQYDTKKQQPENQSTFRNRRFIRKIIRCSLNTEDEANNSAQKYVPLPILRMMFAQIHWIFQFQFWYFRFLWFD